MPHDGGNLAVRRAARTRVLAAVVVGLCLPSPFGLVLSPGDAWAQVRPGTVQPGQVERQLEKPREPTARAGVVTIPDPSATPPPNADAIEFVLNQLTVDGVTVYPAEALRREYEGALGTRVTLAGVYRIVDALTARYRNDGYILSQVIVPAQSVENGAIRLQAIEGHIAAVRVEGGSAALNARVSRYAEKVRAVRPLTAAALERYVLLVNDIPGVQARAILTPATTPGAADLVLMVSQRQHATGFSFDTRGSRAQGRSRLFGDLDLHSLFGGASLTELRAVSTADRELDYLAAAHDQLVGTEGTRIGVAGTYVYSRPQELAIVPLELTTTSQSLSLNVSHPLLRSRVRNLSARAVLSVFNSRTTVFGVKDTADRLRAARFGLTFDTSDRLGGINLADLEFSQGLPVLGASADVDQYRSRPGGRADFRKATLHAARLQVLPARWSVALAVNAQFALSDLLSPELFAVGGEQFARGYDFAELLSDHGVAVKLDVRYSHAWTRRMPATLMPYLFFDYGRAWQRTSSPGLGAKDSAASSGGGLRLTLRGQLSAFVELAKPLTKIVDQEHNRRVRIYAGLSVQ